MVHEDVPRSALTDSSLDLDARPTKSFALFWGSSPRKDPFGRGIPNVLKWMILTIGQ